MTPTRPKLLSPKQRIRIGKCNVRTMYQVGKVHQVAKEIQRLNLGFIGIRKSRTTNLVPQKLYSILTQTNVNYVSH